MAVKTFIGWFFGWLSAFKIDFQKEIDPFCGYNPRVLACDGKHIGVSLRHLKLEKPVRKPDKEDVIQLGFQVKSCSCTLTEEILCFFDFYHCISCECWLLQSFCRCKPSMGKYFWVVCCICQQEQK